MWFFFRDAKTSNFYFKFLKQLFLAFIWVARFVINKIKMKPNNCFFISKNWKFMKNRKKMGTFDFLNPSFTCLYHKNSSNRTEFYQDGLFLVPKTMLLEKFLYYTQWHEILSKVAFIKYFILINPCSIKNCIDSLCARKYIWREKVR